MTDNLYMNDIVEYIYFSKLRILIEFDGPLPTDYRTELFIEYLHHITDKYYIDRVMQLLNKYSRTDLIAILLDKKKEIDLSEDFEL